MRLAHSHDTEALLRRGNHGLVETVGVRKSLGRRQALFQHAALIFHALRGPVEMRVVIQTVGRNREIPGNDELRQLRYHDGSTGFHGFGNGLEAHPQPAKARQRDASEPQCEVLID